jgi:hypothetical protein
LSAEGGRPPFYIVGLPEEPIEANEAKLKFERLSSEFCKVYPFIEEIRAVIKSKKATGMHARYEVSRFTLRRNGTPSPKPGTILPPSSTRWGQG